MNELEQIFTEMLNNIDDCKQVYNKPEWDNRKIVQTWIKAHETQLKKLFISGVSNCKTEPKLGKLETELGKLEKVHGEIVKYFDVHSGCDSFKFKDGAVYRVKLERSFGKATLD